MMIDRDEFLKSYNIEQEDFEAADMPWEELAAIYEDYQAMEGKLRNIGKDFVYDYLYDIERAGIHSYRYRTKDPGHLLEKIIRKRVEHFERFKDINRTNYHKYVTDLIGIRVFSCTVRTGSISITILPVCLRMTPGFMYGTGSRILTGIPGIIILQSGPRSTGVTGIPGYTMRT